MPNNHQQTARIGTRESKLAGLQTDIVVQELSTRFPNLGFEIVTIKTGGDKVLNKPIADLGIRGVFVKELEEALLTHTVDLVVHSLKDLPTDLPAGLTLAAVLDRRDPRDVLVSRGHIPLASLQPGARVATSSRRRTAQLCALRPDLTFLDIRGNIPTRLKKLDEGLCDAMILAAAGLIRLEMTERITEFLEPQLSTPAVGQGALAVECRENDHQLTSLLQEIDNAEVRAQITAERSFLFELGGGCSIPIGALARSTNAQLHLTGCVASLDGLKIVRAALAAPHSEAVDLGQRLAAIMLESGAREILDDLKILAPNSVSPP